MRGRLYTSESDVYGRQILTYKDGCYTLESDIYGQQTLTYKDGRFTSESDTYGQQTLTYKDVLRAGSVDSNTGCKVCHSINKMSLR